MPFCQWPGMWQPRRSCETSAAAAGTCQVTSTRCPDGTTTRMPDTSGGTLTTGVGPGGASIVASSAASQASWTA